MDYYEEELLIVHGAPAQPPAKPEGCLSEILGVCAFALIGYACVIATHMIANLCHHGNIFAK